jgi:uncharacterized protein
MHQSKYLIIHQVDPENFLLVHTLTGALDIVKKEIIDYLNNPENNGIDKNIIKQLISRGYLNSETKTEETLLGELLNLHLQNTNNEMVFVICPTYTCNLRCVYCFEDIQIRRNNKVINKNEVDLIYAAIKNIRDLKDGRKGSVELYGGEPFQPATKEINAYIFEKASQENYHLKVISNGVNINDFRDILAQYALLIDGIQITLDGPKEIHDRLRVNADGIGTYDQIVTNVDLVLSLGIKVALRVNAGKNNVKYLPQVLQVIKKQHWNTNPNFICNIAPILDHYSTGKIPNWMPESELLLKIYALFDDFEAIREEYHLVLGTDMERRTALIRSIWAKENKKVTPFPVSCMAGCRNTYVFGSDNLIYACPETVGIEKYAIGQYSPEFSLKDDMEKIWERNVANIEKCKNCNIAALCGSGCTWASLATNGANFKEPVCNYAHETIANFLQLNNERIAALTR